MPINKTKKGVKNIIISILTQLSILLIGMILPRLIMMSYGSETNGLFSSIKQIYGYVALLEAGIGASTVQALYKPIVDGNRDAISSMLVATRNYFRKITKFYFLCVVALSVIYPLVVKSEINKIEMALVVLFIGLSNVFTFWFTATIRQLMTANGDGYIVNDMGLLTTVFEAIGKIILVTISANIVFIQVSHFLINIIVIFVYLIIFKKKYSWIDFKAKPDNSALNQKNYFLVHEISGTIFNCTDVVLLTIYSLSTVSVYTVYNMVYAAVKTMISSVSSSITFLLGQTYSESKEKYIKLHDAYESYYTAFSFSLITVAYFLILPFVKLYTDGLGDADIYIDKWLPVLFSMIALLSFSRMTANSLINIAGHAKQNIPSTILEASINLTSSIILATFMGMYGVLLGSVIALFYRSNYMLIYENIKILKRKPIRTYATVLLNFALFGLAVFINEKLNIVFDNYFDFVIYGLIFTVTVVPTFFIVNSLANPQGFVFVKNIILKKRKK